MSALMAKSEPEEQEGGYIAITGGAGFIGTNVAHRLLSEGKSVAVLDNLSRPGVTRNLDWLRRTHGDRFTFIQADVRDAAAIRPTIAQASHVYHFAAQVAVTTSLEDPELDFEVNALGTLNVLEAIRCARRPVSLVFTSTNKVYGRMVRLRLRLNRGRYEPEDDDIHARGIGETQALEFHSPYGCSKGAAEQYVLDYARTYGIPAAVFRMSCIYGTHQFGTEDQGWVAHFLIQALRGEPITIYGDGRQVRDVLFVEDLVDALLLARRYIRRISSQAFNIGGGPSRTLSLRELVSLIGEIQGRAPNLSFQPWRTADQRYYVSDTRRFSEVTGWQPRVEVRAGVEALHEWLVETVGRPASEVARVVPPADSVHVRADPPAIVRSS